MLVDEFQVRGIKAEPYGIDAALVRAVLEWEEDFLGFAGIPRSES